MNQKKKNIVLGGVAVAAVLIALVVTLVFNRGPDVEAMPPGGPEQAEVHPNRGVAPGFDPNIGTDDTGS